MTPINLNMLVNMEPEAIVKWYESKGYVFSWDWKDTWQEAHAKSFTVAKVMKLDILQSINDEVKKTQTDGNTVNEFQKDLEPTLKKLGWWGKVPAKDVPGWNGKGDPNQMVQLGSPRRLKTIYFTNANVAYNSGRWNSQFENKKERPYLRYNQVQRSSKRDDHAKFHHKVYRVDDPIWDIIYPPNGWHCGCYVNALTEAELKSSKLEVSESTAAERSKTNVEEGWNFNPGKAAFEPDLSKYDDNIAKLFDS